MKTLSITLVALALTGCATHQQANTVTGAAVGAVVGNAVGGTAGRNAGAVLGAVIGNNQPTQSQPQPVYQTQPQIIYQPRPMACYQIPIYNPYGYLIGYRNHCQ